MPAVAGRLVTFYRALSKRHVFSKHSRIFRNEMSFDFLNPSLYPEVFE